MCVYIYIYREREREREGGRDREIVSTSEFYSNFTEIIIEKPLAVSSVSESLSATFPEIRITAETDISGTI